MLAVAQLGEEAHTVNIQETLAKQAGRGASLGAIYAALDRLERKRCVESWLLEPTAARGGRAKRCYSLTDIGSLALSGIRQVRERMWRGCRSGVRASWVWLMRRPPALADRLLRSVMPPARHRDVEADLHELHSRVLARHGALVAAGRYWIEVVLLLMWRPWRRRHGEDHRRGSRFESLVHDIRYGLRGLRHNPGYAAAAVVTLALGIGVNTAMFTLVNGVVLKGLPVPEPDRLAMVWEVSPSGSRTVAAAANYADWRDSTEAFSELAIVSFWEPTLLDPEIPVSLNGGEVSANFLDVMGLEPALGRDVTSADEQDGAERTAWLSHGLWQNMYAADTNVIGRAIHSRGGRLHRGRCHAPRARPGRLRTADLESHTARGGRLARVPRSTQRSCDRSLGDGDRARHRPGRAGRHR